MQYLIGMFSAFGGLIAIYTVTTLFTRKERGQARELLDHWRKANVLAERRASALERIADAMEDRNGQGLQ